MLNILIFLVFKIFIEKIENFENPKFEISENFEHFGNLKFPIFKIFKIFDFFRWQFENTNFEKYFQNIFSPRWKNIFGPGFFLLSGLSLQTSKKLFRALGEAQACLGKGQYFEVVFKVKRSRCVCATLCNFVQHFPPTRVAFKTSSVTQEFRNPPALFRRFSNEP